MDRRCSIVAACAAIAGGSALAAEPHVTFSVIADAAAVRAGGRFTLGLSFAIEKKWHMYWPGQNDSGLPPTWEVDLPPGWTAGGPGETVWPTPHRHVAPGGILDHVFEGELLVLVPINVPANAAPGPVTLRASASWLVCDEACVPEKGKAELVLVVAEPSARPGPGPSAPRIAAAREAAPASLPRPEVKAEAKAEVKAEVKVEVRDGQLEAWAAGADRIEFYPSENSVPLADPLDQGVAKGERLVARLNPSAAPGAGEATAAAAGAGGGGGGGGVGGSGRAEPVTGPKVDGILAVFPKNDGRPRSYRVSLPFVERTAP